MVFVNVYHECYVVRSLVENADWQTNKRGAWNLSVHIISSQNGTQRTELSFINIRGENPVHFSSPEDTYWP